MSLAIDVGIGLAFVFALVALMCTGLQEMLSASLNLRGKTLWEGVQSMLQANAPANVRAVASGNVPGPTEAGAALAAAAATGADPRVVAPTSAGEAGQPVDESAGMLLAAAMRVHPLITGLVPDRFGLRGLVEWMRGTRLPKADIGSAKPSYLQASTFATVLADKIGEAWKGGSQGFNDFGMAVAAMPECALKNVLQGMVRDTQGDAAKLRAHVEAWYDETMVRVSGWYKRRVQVLLLLVGVALAGLMNIDAIHLAGALATQPGLRTALADRAAAAAVAAHQAKAAAGAGNQAAAGDTAEPERTAIAARKALQDLTLPIGWTGGRPVAGMLDALLMILGWLITGFAASFGAPFWFDLIGKVAPLRSAGGKPAAAPEPALANVNTVPIAATPQWSAASPGVTAAEPFRAALNDYEAHSLSAGDIVQIKRMLGVGRPGAETSTLDQDTRDAIRKKQEAMGWPASGELSARWVGQLRTGGA